MGPSLKVFSDLFKEEFNNQEEQWLSTMKSELKVVTLDNLTTKKHLDLGNWPTLSLNAVHSQQMNSTTSWKKAAQTYHQIDATKIELSLLDDLEGGARALQKDLPSERQSFQIGLHLLFQSKHNQNQRLHKEEVIHEFA